MGHCPCRHLTVVPGFRAFSRLPVARFPVVGLRFPTPWRLVSHSHGTVAWRLLPYFPCSAAFATPRWPFPLGHIPPLALSPCLSPHPLFIPHRAGSNPMARANWILIHPGTPSCVLHRSLLSCPLLFGLFVSCWTPWGIRAVTPSSWPRPRIPFRYPRLYPTGPPASHDYTPLGRLLPCWASPRVHFLPHALLGHIRSPAACSLRAACLLAVHLLIFLLGAHPVGRPLPVSLCVSLPCPVVSCCFCFFVLPSSMHARTSPQHRSSGYASPLFSSLVLLPPRGVHLGGPGRSQVGPPPSRHPLSSLLPALPSSPVSRLSPVLLLSCPVCAALLLSAPGLYPCVSQPKPGLLSCRPTWAAFPGTPLGGFPRRPAPPASPPSVP